jgi:adenosylcobinamide-phosphate synthase
MPVNNGLYIFIAYLVDLAVGDPAVLPHPVVLMGKVIDCLEGLTRRVARSRAALRVAGALTAAVVVAGSWLLTFLLIKWMFNIHHWLGTALTVWFISTTMAGRGLASAAGEIFDLLMNGNLAEARRKVGWIVGRDTEEMNSGEVTRATVETVAENIVDGIVSPIFYAFIGGAPLAMAYRAVNTLDSMLGYKDDRYIDFGMIPARLDDLANYIPARLTGFLLLIAASFARMSPRRALAAILRDASGHPSPNSGIPEAAVAGALGVRLGGLNYYHGRESFRAYMGENLTPLEPKHIKQATNLMYLTSSLAAGLSFIFSVYFIIKN